MSKIDRPGNWCKIWPKNCCEVWRKCCRNRPRKGRPENGQKSAEKGSEIGREKFGRKRLAAKLLQIRPGHSCDQFLPAMNSQSSINWVQLRNLNLWFVKTSTEASTFWWEASVDRNHVVHAVVLVLTSIWGSVRRLGPRGCFGLVFTVNDLN